MHGQVDQPGWRGLEATGIEIERREVFFEVNVKPLAVGRLVVLGSMADKRRRDTPPLMRFGDLGIEEEGVIASVPCHVDKADQAAILEASGHPAEAVGPDLIPPPGRGLTAMCCDQCHHFCVGDWSTPAVLNRLGHMPDRPVSRCRRQQTSMIVLGLVLSLRPAAFAEPGN
jgi:hypothetical protein